MGAAIAARFTELFPQQVLVFYPKLIRIKVTSLIIVSGAGLPVITPIGARLATLPFVGELVSRLPKVAESFLRAHIDHCYAKPESEPFKSNILVLVVENEMTSQKRRLFLADTVRQHSGFIPSIISTLRHFPLSDMEVKSVLEGALTR